MSQFTYEPVNTSCVSVYNQLYGDELKWTSDSKNKRKALAFMNTGQGRNDNAAPFQKIDSCVYPSEAKTVMKLDNTCMMMNSDTNTVLDANYEPTYAGFLNIDTQERQQQVMKGQSVYPSEGCGVHTFDKKSLKSAINTSKDILNADNNKELKCIQDKINATLNEINDFINVKVPAQQKALDKAIYNYNVTLNNCNYHDWWQKWYMQYGQPWAVNYLSTLQSYLNWMRNDYWNAVNDYGKWRADQCNANKKGFKNNSRGPGDKPEQWNYCMDVYRWSHAPGGEVVGWDCHGGQNQQWETVNDNLPGSMIKSIESGMCLDVAGSGTESGTKLIQLPCHGGPNQRFGTTNGTDIRPLHTENLAIKAKRQGKTPKYMCIDPSGYGENGQQLELFPCENGVNRYQDQKWKYEGVGNKYKFNMQNV